MRAAKVQASLRIRAVSPEPSLLTHTSSESRGTFRQKARSLAPLNGWACAVKICHDGMLEDTNSLDGAQLISSHFYALTSALNTLKYTGSTKLWPKIFYKWVAMNLKAYKSKAIQFAKRNHFGKESNLALNARSPLEVAQPLLRLKLIGIVPFISMRVF